MKNRNALLRFYDFPAEHWKHMRTTDPIESIFATVRHRTIRAKGCMSNETAIAMVCKLIQAAQRSRRRLDGTDRSPKVISVIKLREGIEEKADPLSPPAEAVAV